MVDLPYASELTSIALTDFVAGLVNGGGKRGLWLSGPRKAGTSTAVEQMVENNLDAFPGYRVRRTLALLDRQLRELWRLEKLLGANGSDFGVYEDVREIELALDRFWTADVVWLDDVYPETDTAHFSRNILLRLDEALKASKIVLVSGNCPPDFFNDDWTKVIDKMFKIVVMED